MVSKTVIVAFVALCCAQAFAAPRSEEAEFALGAHQLGSSYFKCVKDLTKSLTVVNDIKSIVDDVKTVISTNQAAKAACTTDKDGNAATEEAVKECKKAAQNELFSELVGEVTKVSAKVAADWPVIKNIIDECF